MADGGESSINLDYPLKMVASNASNWVVSGYNSFGQLNPSYSGQTIQQFQEFQPPFESNSLLLSCSWSYIAVADGCSLQLHGFVSGGIKIIKSITTDISINSLASCDNFCLILLENGKVYKCSLQNDKEKLEEVNFQRNLTIPVESNFHHGIRHVACGNKIMAAIGTSNEVFAGVTQVYQLPKTIRPKLLVCGFEHALLLTFSGDIYSWGNGLRGQLGNDVSSVEEVPVLVEALAGIEVTHISASGWHSCAISSFGDLYAWGYNSNGQLGIRVFKNESCFLKTPAVYPLPQLIDVICRCAGSNRINCTPIKVATGARHTVLLMDCGSIFATGWNVYGQLGSGNTKILDAFEFIMNVTCNVENTKIICGSWCTFIGF
ncbi:probable E3 ubiquitin-protein ligase HERC4 isoform X1 [Stomoxys calcitrans]|uniref:probable E3 ubiquitin-protein ligase HERC4 isoform X1 n=1 Tax=Stomoxys calcitrans TaxID=35570 RepID=UPI0027E2CF8D|nr:probable E3 ubiquitin-protein ligase HERC4 isoform X1 [Stomoxys calcitrans]XP_059218036.1 probable E3 ubiquitin-protein ligase HERC4 isoform X1 [Stomoxys calcitrans]